ncbi:TIGR02186 family protein [Desulfobacca acetoxidans]|uniref:TIGR02186 family protein n=1 Tax=Desulfobacca acetoxidans (strain ATCC 700848 / DSM 11109 / ASRB2) TaxID=880072 RepID=F2NCJ1_DESAR|nr:TIGR02186 family protein [Desulfobacca acetoxidans]AEB09125.1 Conserved hypothetical protein CHP02186-related, transmembrane [Desulfobacca acetoxidans DSM 11109]
MMKRILIILIAVGWMAMAGIPAWAVSTEGSEKVLTAASKRDIDISLFYKGDRVYFFGVNPVAGSDLVVRLTAEKAEEIKLSMKGKVGPFWMTVKQYEVTNAPFIYKIHASKPLEQIISEDQAKELGLGYDAVKSKMKMHLVRGDAAPEDGEELFKGLLKIKQDANLYRIVEDDPQSTKEAPRLEITEGKLFKHYFTFPPAATEGKYQVESFSFQNGEMVGYGKDVIEIRKVGLEGWITHASQEYAVFYGIGAVLIALGAGLLVGMIFKKGGHH